MDGYNNRPTSRPVWGTYTAGGQYSTGQDNPYVPPTGWQGDTYAPPTPYNPYTPPTPYNPYNPYSPPTWQGDSYAGTKGSEADTWTGDHYKKTKKPTTKKPTPRPTVSLAPSRSLAPSSVPSTSSAPSKSLAPSVSSILVRVFDRFWELLFSHSCYVLFHLVVTETKEETERLW